MATNTERIPLAEAAATLQTTPLNLLMHLKRGLLRGVEIDGAWFIESASLDEYRSSRGSAAHGAVCQGKSHCGGCGGGKG